MMSKWQQCKWSIGTCDEREDGALIDLLESGLDTPMLHAMIDGRSHKGDKHRTTIAGDGSNFSTFCCGHARVTRYTSPKALAAAPPPWITALATSSMSGRTRVVVLILRSIVCVIPIPIFLFPVLAHPIRSTLLQLARRVFADRLLMAHAFYGTVGLRTAAGKPMSLSLP